jgi:hypothetical protein
MQDLFTRSTAMVNDDQRLLRMCSSISLSDSLKAGFFNQPCSRDFDVPIFKRVTL